MTHTFEDKTMVELLELILLGDETGDEAMWYVLHERMREMLLVKYQECGEGLWDAYEDFVDDFFLYLREGKGKRVQKPYMALQKIQNKGAFDKWLVSTWRNFLCNRTEKERGLQMVSHVDADGTTICYNNGNVNSVFAQQVMGTGSSTLISGQGDLSPRPLTDEQKIEVVSQLIAYCDQVFLPRGRFIFLRTLLTLLNKQNALPEKKMAEALGMTDINYRVTNHRLKVNMRLFLERLLKGERLRLDDKHKEICNCINEDFDRLYGVLLKVYNDVIQTFRYRDSVMALRLANTKPDGTMLHEEEVKTYKMGIRAFWSKLQRELNR